MHPGQNLLSDERVAALARGESIQVRVQGVSMLPWLRPGDAVGIWPLTRRLHPGDVALFWRDERHPVLHRVVGVRSEGETILYDCLGDAEHGPPEAVPASAVLGVMETTPVRRGFYRLLVRPRRWINRFFAGHGICLRHG